MAQCDRCGNETSFHTCSMFNTEQICMKCKAAEKRHPRYQEAAAQELAAVRAGNWNFPGIGLPDELRNPRVS